MGAGGVLLALFTPKSLYALGHKRPHTHGEMCNSWYQLDMSDHLPGLGSEPNFRIFYMLYLKRPITEVKKQKGLEPFPGFLY